MARVLGEGFVKDSLQIHVDGRKAGPYRVVHRDGGRIVRCFGQQDSRWQVPPVKRRRTWRRHFALFLIVGKDEGTCGQRLQVRRF